MNYTNTYLNTFIPELPKLLNNNFKGVANAFDIIYDSSAGVLLKPVNTTGLIKGTTGRFVTLEVDNLIVKTQWTNLLDNNTTIDSQYYNTYIDDPVVPRDPCTLVYEVSVGYYIDVEQPYYKIVNSYTPYVLKTDQLGQEVHFIFDVSEATDYRIVLNPLATSSIYITAADAALSFLKLICVGIDSSANCTWSVKEFGGNFYIA